MNGNWFESSSGGSLPKKQEVLPAANFNKRTKLWCCNLNVYYRNEKFVVQRAKTIQQKNQDFAAILHKLCLYDNTVVGVVSKTFLLMQEVRFYYAPISLKRSFYPLYNKLVSFGRTRKIFLSARSQGVHHH